MRLIDANSLAKWLDKEHYVDKPTGKCDERQNRVLGICISALKNPQIAPTIDAVPVVHGRWILGDPITCSVCWKPAAEHDSPITFLESPYCPWCGAKMDEKEE